MPPLWAGRPGVLMMPMYTGPVSVAPVSGSASTPFPLVGGCLRFGSFCQVDRYAASLRSNLTAPSAPAAGSYGRNGVAFLPLVKQKEENEKEYKHDKHN